MLLNFDQMPANITPKMRGGEGEVITWMFINEDTKIMRGLLAPGCSIGLHVHETDSELVYVLFGTGKVLYDGEYKSLSAGSCHYCPKGHEHSLINDSDKDMVFLAMVPKHGG